MKKSSAKKPARRGATKATPATAPLLIELRTEELPPKSLKQLAQAFAQGVIARLAEAAFCAPDASHRVYATPRRLAALIDGVAAKQADRDIERRGPAVKSALDANGNPTPALLGFAKSCGVTVDKLARRSDTKGEYFVYLGRQKGVPLKQELAGLVAAALKALPAPKLMRWGDNDAEFVRPVHGLVMLHGATLVPGTVLGLKSGNKTRGHRFLSKGDIAIPSAARYAATLQSQGKVIANFDERRRAIKEQLAKAEKDFRIHDRRIDMDTTLSLAHQFPGGSLDAAERARSYGGGAALLDEVTALTEWPAVYMGEFDAHFLDVPLECLTLSMKQHQKYFPVFDRAARLLPKFAIVSNLAVKNPTRIIAGNQKVLRARLADAKFFYDQDRKTKLAERIPRLGSVVYQAKLGTQLDRVRRIERIATGIADALSDSDTAVRERTARAAQLCKADLVTDMVGEFPELQGVMGGYYAAHDGEHPHVAQAIAQHYRPRFAGDALPEGTPAISVALADKLETLVGIYGIGLIPSGDKDPFGLRRAAQGVVRLLVERELALPLDRLLAEAAGAFAPDLLAADTAVKLRGFVLERLRSYLREREFANDEIEAVVGDDTAALDQVVPRLRALKAFRNLREAGALAAANKRVRNILRQAGAAAGDTIDVQKLASPAEQALHGALEQTRAKVAPLLARADYTEALRALAQLQAPVDRFFDDVMVMVDDAAVRTNRLALLGELARLCSQVADISRLQTPGANA